MATLTLSSSFNMFEEDQLNWMPVSHTGTQATLVDGIYTQVISGSGFSYDGSWNLLSGTVTSIEYSRSGAPVFSITGMNVPAADMQTFIDTSNDTQATYAYVFEGNDTMNGSGEHDVLLGFGGNDSMSGGGGNDNLIGGAGNDTINGGDGFDWAEYWDATAAVTVTLSGASNGTVVGNGTVGTDTLIEIEGVGGSGFDDSLTGSSYNEAFFGDSGNDTIDGKEGVDRVNYDYTTLGRGVTVNLTTGVASDGRGGTDTLRSIENVYGSSYSDNITGSAAANWLQGQDGNDTVFGLDGNDELYGGTGNDSLVGGAGNDWLSGWTGNDILLGGAGSDGLRGGAGNDTLDGGVFLDRINHSDINYVHYGDSTSGVNVDLSGITGIGNTGSGTANDGMGGRDTLYNISQVVGSDYNDTLKGSSALVFEEFTGGKGNDSIDGGAITDTLNGQNGNRVFYINAIAGVDVNLAARQASGADGNDTLLNINSIVASSYGDTLTGSDRTDVSEQFEGLGGDDTIDGAGGTDSAVYSNATAAVSVSLADGTAKSLGVDDAGSGSDTLINIEGVSGSRYADSLVGGNAASDALEYFQGGGGNDTIDGGSGYDRVDFTWAKAGVSVTLGGSGNGSASGDSSVGVDTLISIEAVRGSSFADTLTGCNDIDIQESFEGREGNDTINGMGGIDRADYRASKAGVTVNLTTGTASDGYGGTDTLINIENVRGSRDFNDSITGDGEDNKLEGQGGNDTLIGLGGNDTLDGGDGSDILKGGIGDDTYRVDLTSSNTLQDTLTENLNEGNDTVILRGGNAGLVTTSTLTLGANVENLDASGTAAGTKLNLTGNALENTLTGNSEANVLSGGTGNDTLIGEKGNDIYLIDSVDDVVTEEVDEGIDLVKIGVATANGTYFLTANVENATLTNTVAFNITGNALSNTLTGNAAANVLTGGDGNDTLDGLGGADSLDGGAGDDTYVVDNAGDVVTEAAGEGIDTAKSSITYTLADPDLEVLILTGSGAINGTGNALDNMLIGNAAANSLVGGGGVDVLDGGAGNDTLDGGSGADMMTGGAGNDTYIVDNPGDAIAETSTLATEIDTVRSSLSFDLSQAGHEQLENLTLTGSGNITGTGNAKANTIIGNDGRNTLTGGGGADILQGGKENDQYFVNLIKTGTLATLEDTVIENLNEGFDGITLMNAVALDTATTLTLGANIESLDAAFTGTTKLNLTGNALDNVLAGNSAANILNGLAGADNMFGYGGNDTYIVDNTGDQVTEFDAADGTDLVEVNIATAGLTYTLTEFVENARLTNTLAFNLIGNALDNVLTGNAAANVLDGGTGADTLVGGAGNDTYVVDNVGDVVTETSTVATEIDTVRADIDYTLGTNVENLTLVNGTNGTGNSLANFIEGTGWANHLSGLGGADTLKGYEGDDWLQGGEGNDILDGGTGADLMEGGTGNDSYIVDDAGDSVTETSALATEIDTVFSSVDYTLGANVENLTLTAGVGNLAGAGNALANVITGNATGNELEGGGGADTLIGGLGDDAYIVNLKTVGAGAAAIAALEDTVTEAAGGGNHDRLDLRGTAGNTVATTLSLSGVLANFEDIDASQTGSTLINLTGNAAANELYGNDAANLLDGGTGIDALHGEDGNDTYLIDHADDRTLEEANEGIDLAKVGIATANGTYTLEANVEYGALTNAVAFTLTGNTLDNVLTGNAAANTLIGGDGNDTLDGGAGVDYMGGGAGNDTYVVDATGDIVEDIGGGIDTVVAKLATGTYELTSEGVENLILSGTASINGRGNELANLLVGNDAANKLEGLDDDDRLEGWGGNDTLDGGLGVDTMIGGAGNDTYVVDSSSDLTEEDAGALAGVDLVLSSVDLSLAANIENLTLTGTAVQGFGNTLANRITGNASGNILDGNEGADTLDGGLGDDTYQVDLKTVGNVAMLEDTVIEAVGGGTDTLMLLGSGTNTVASKITLEGTNLENMAANNTGTTLLNLTGNAANNIITGNDADNLIDGGLGADGMNGGLGNDTYVLDNVGDSVTETSAVGGIDTLKIRFGSAGGTYVLGNGNNLENVTLTNTVAFHVTGNELNNALTGNAAANSLVGGLGNDTLDGLGGIDTLNGGDGDDTYVVDVSGDVIQDSDGTDTVLAKLASGTYTLAAGLENLTLGGAAAINGVGNAAGNQILGNNAANSLSGGGGNDQLIDMGGGNDTLDGGAGADVMMGGLGSDTYIVDDSFDTVTENIAIPTDIDTVLSSVTFTLGDNLENLTLTGAGNINGTGNALSNKIIGNSGNNRLTDTAGGNDSLVGGDGSDTLYGGAGVDTLVGGTGNDRYEVNLVVATGALEDVIVEVGGAAGGINDAIVLQNSASNTVATTLTLAADIEHLYASSTGDTKLNLTGNASNNILVGNAADNILGGGVGVDSLYGLAGNDTYLVDNAADVVTENAGEGTDLVKLGIAMPNGTYTLSSNVENAILTNAVAFTLKGNSENNSLTGNAAANLLIGLTGNDTLDGGAGIDIMEGGDGNDTYIVDSILDQINELDGEGTADLVKSSVSYSLDHNLEELTLTGVAAINGTGNTLDNMLVGNDAANVLDGKAGADILRGGKGNDTYVVDDAGDVVLEVQNEGTDWVRSSISIDLAFAPNVENLTLTGTANINGAGNALANVITGNVGDNELSGGDGNDSLAGGAGNDTLDGNAGNDTLVGGDGDDTYVVDSASDVVSETSVAVSNDRVISAISYVLGANVEHLTLSGAQNINATGNTLNNVLTGNSGDNVLTGGAGVDTFAGGLGNDTYLIDSANEIANITELSGEGDDDTLIVGFNTANSFDIDLGGVLHPTLAHIEHVTLTGTGGFSLIGNDADNYLVGNASSNHIEGRGGNDTLDGKAGADYMIGGTGNDIYYVDNANDQVQELSGEGTDSIFSSVSFTMRDANAYSEHVENLTLVSGSAALNATGNGRANILTGNAAGNILDGWLGNDTMIGGAGNDTYKVHDTGDVIIENASEGTDTVISTETHTLQANVENLTLDTFMGGHDGTGNSLNNVITGDAYNNVLSGLAGNDTLNSGAGDDMLIGGDGQDSMSGGNGDDQYYVDNAGDVVIEALTGGTGDRVVSSISYTLAANVEFLALSGTDNLNGTGNALNNTLNGNSGNNVLSGGAGVDTYFGEAGNDTYMLDAAAELSNVTDTAGNDTLVLGYNVAVATTIALTGALADIENLTASGTGLFSLTGNSAANILIGNASANILDGDDGNDTLRGGAGNDTLWASVGNDSLAGDDGNDLLSGSSGLDTLDGGAGDDYLNGGADNDSLIGGLGNDTLRGDVGNDTLAGGAGNDTYVVDTASDVVTELVAEGIDLVQSSVTFALATNVENLTLTEFGSINGSGNELANILTGNSGNNSLSGGVGNDTLSGGEGNDTLRGEAGNDSLTGGADGDLLDGGAGNDVMTGGDGDDIYVVDNIADVVVETTAALNPGGFDIVYAPISYTLGANVEELLLDGANAINGTGNTLDNYIAGNSAANKLSGLVGNDTLRGWAGNDTLDGGMGIDSLIGGLGDDTFVVDSASDVVTEATDEGMDKVLSSVTYSLASADYVENLTLTGVAAISATGNGEANVLTGNSAANTLSGADGNDTLIGGAGNDSLDGGAGNDSLDGGVGNDTLIGGLGDDTYVVDSVLDVLTEWNAEGIDLVQSSVSHSLGHDVEHLTLTGVAAINATGNTLGNHLLGNDAANVLDGLGGADTLEGGKGSDTYIVDNDNDVLIEAGLAGDIDLVKSSVSFILSDNSNGNQRDQIENLTLTGSGDLYGAGNAKANLIIGNDGNNILDGASGTDTLRGGKGNDDYYVDLVKVGDGATATVRLEDFITENLNEGSDWVKLKGGTIDLVNATTLFLGANVENMLAGNDTGLTKLNLTGNALNNQLTGNHADNILDGGSGNDTLAGENGNDTYIIDSLLDEVFEGGGMGTDLVKVNIATSGTYTLTANVEHATLINAVAFNLIGNILNNALTGNAAANIMDGGIGNDTLVGGAGNDVYVVDSAGDVVIEGVNAGIDTVQSSVAYTLADKVNLEHLTLTGSSNINASGNDLANTLTGNDGNNSLDGGAGNDRLVGGAGSDTLFGGAGSDTLVGGKGSDTYYIDVLTDKVVESAGDPFEEGLNDTVYVSLAGPGTYTLDANVERAFINNETVGVNLNGHSGGGGLWGNNQANILDGKEGNDSLTGNEGDDTLIGGQGDDTMWGGQGNDVYRVDSLGDVVNENPGEGTDRIETTLNIINISGSGGTQYVENLTFIGTGNLDAVGNSLDNVITGGAGNDTLAGLDGSDTLIGEAGNDMLWGAIGDKTMRGGLGNDVYDVDSLGDNVIEALGEGTDRVEASQNYTLTANVENLTLRGTADLTGTGNDLANVLLGNSGNNTLSGGAGNDTLSGGDGVDELTGGLGHDRFIFDTADALVNADTITDFVSGTDKIALSEAIFGELGNVSAITNLTGLGSHFAYDAATGALSYDADGVGGNDAIQFATLGTTTHPATLGMDFMIVA